MSVLYNENDPYAAQWLENLVDAGFIAPGAVNRKSIVDLDGRELDGIRQAHFFAGIGVWSAALRAAGWPDNRPVWTGSCPCQPFSAAGRGAGFADPRHLWPAWFRLIRQHRPRTVFGEQVEGPAGRAWLDLVFTDLEGCGYACGTVVFPAAGVGAPHLRHRTYWTARLADADDSRSQGRRQPGRERAAERPVGAGGVAGGLADAEGFRRRGERGELGAPQDDGIREISRQGPGVSELGHSGELSRLADADAEGRRPARGGVAARASDAIGQRSATDRPRSPDSFWDAADWIFCRDGKWRPAQPGIFPLVDGASFRLGSGSPLAGKSRTGMLRAAGNAIVLQQAQAFIEAFLELEALNA